MYEDNVNSQQVHNNITLNDIKIDLKENSRHEKRLFPIEVFPQEISSFIIDMENAFNSDVNFFSSSILAAISLAIGNSFKLQVKPTHFVKANLYLAIVGRTGQGKTPVMKQAFEPIRIRQKENYEIYRKELASWESATESRPKPVNKQLLLNDFTVEALLQIHSYNPMGIGIFADELLGWFNNMSRYNNGSDKELYLSLWNGDSVGIDRVGKSIFVESSFLSIIGGIQPAKLKEIINSSLDSNGFVHRILWTPPVSDLFQPEDDQEPNSQHIQNYKLVIDHILKYRNELDETVISMSYKARKLALDWKNDFKLKYHYEEEYLRGTSIKLSEYMYRFCLIMTVLDTALFEIKENATKDFTKIEVDTEIVSSAIKIVSFFMESAIEIRKEMKDPLVNSSSKVRKWHKKLPQTFKTQDAIEIGTRLKISTSTVEKHLADYTLFEKIRHGQYKKKN
ncbi:MAG: hypothetical protein CMC08_03110 [Flavobacteriaceae bacterium]|nr:hypothetical protein [Flavobacteriaceae bacterium]